MTIGQLRHRVTIQQRATGQDAAGQPNGAWSTLATVWADIRHQSGGEAIRSDKEVSTLRASIRIRQRDDVTARMRVAYKATTYEILTVVPDLRDRKFVDLVCEVVT